MALLKRNSSTLTTLHTPNRWQTLRDSPEYTKATQWNSTRSGSYHQFIIISLNSEVHIRQPIPRESIIGCLAELVKALVWFWLIDETLSANLVYQSDHDIDSTLQTVKQMKIIT